LTSNKSASGGNSGKERLRRHPSSTKPSFPANRGRNNNDNLFEEKKLMPYSQIEKQTPSAKNRRKKSLLGLLGPGVITGASDDDPSGIATYSQAGAQFGFGMLWLALFLFPLMNIVQEMCARLGLVTGKGLAAIFRTNIQRRLLYQ
jgi:Natural resistance-associated macrophage protein